MFRKFGAASVMGVYWEKVMFLLRYNKLLAELLLHK